ncbi:MAG TPA: Stealth CR1 domain-containing protein [Longimicrobiales bacterium]|nr:Stealth CR1 domain-containing protein [Longimicrobiales bacterium]
MSAAPEGAPPVPVDLVFTWVDGDDPAHRAKRRAWRDGGGTATAPGAEARAATVERERWYRGVGEITFAVRSVVRHMPWVRTIHVVTDAQTPPVDAALLDSGRVRVVDHAGIVPDAYRPVFASTLIESCLHRIPGLSEVWLYDNDDFLHFAPVPPSVFVAPSPGGGVALKLKAYRAAVREAIRRASDAAPRFLPGANPYTAGISNALRVLRARFGVGWRDAIVPRHATQVYRTSTALRLEDELADVLHANRSLRFRDHRQVSWATLAYTLERLWHPEDRLRAWSPFDADPDLAVFDFLHCTRPGTCEARWKAVEASRARLACLNNVPSFERERFERAMEAKGLGAAPLAGPAGEGSP